jgi:hypothetical protein
LNLLNGYGAFGGQLNLLNGYGALEDS